MKLWTKGAAYLSVVGLVATAAYGQSAPQDPQPPVAAGAPTSGVRSTTDHFGAGSYRVTWASQPGSVQDSPGMRSYREAKTDEEKASAKETIKKELDELYDHFIGDREKEIEQLEERIAKLREQLQRRREAKSRMVELKLEMLVSQAEGLGWPDAPANYWYHHFDPSVGPHGATAPVPGSANPFGPAGGAGVMPVYGVPSPAIPSAPPPAAPRSGPTTPSARSGGGTR